jgi:2-C-methyl-D-erythritol 2,4-cyclodiphosphate synthase
MDIRVGIGYDVHQLKAGVPLMIGGISVPHSKGAIGHSDADVLIHALCDALLGAANLGDIGKQFPNSDPALKGIDSKILLQKTIDLLGRQGWAIINIDSTVCLQEPKIAHLIPDMQRTLSSVAGLVPGAITVKATTTEWLGFEGREEGISAMAVALIRKK